MQKTHAFLTAALFVIASALAARPAPQGELTGTITEWRPGHSITLARDSGAITLTLRNTAYDAVPGIQRGARVRVLYRSVGERRFVADHVRVTTDGSQPKGAKSGVE